MITEAVITWFFSVVGKLVDQVFINAGVDAGPGSDVLIGIPNPLFDYVQYTTSQALLVMPAMIAYWTWRQIKA